MKLLPLLLSVLLAPVAAHAQGAPTLPAQLPAPRLVPPSELFGRAAPDPLGTDADFRAATVVGVPLFGSRADAAARLEAIHAEVSAIPARSSIEVIYLPSQRPELAPIHDAFAAGRYLDPVLGVVARELELPVPLRVVMADCGNVNAVYMGGTATLVVCHEVVAAFVDQFRPRFGADRAALGKAVVSATVFTTLHEVGHALIELLRLPVLGNEEDAADRIAAVYLLRDPDVGADRALAAASATGALASFDWDVHPMGAQRRYNVMCLALGALNDPRLEATGETDFNAHRLPGCPAEFETARSALDRLLSPHYAWRRAPRLHALLIGSPAANTRAPLAPPGGWRDPYAEALAYHARLLDGVQTILADGGDAEAVALYVVRFIQANQRKMSALRAVLTGIVQARRKALATDHIFEIFDLLKLRKELRDAHPDVLGLGVVQTFFDLVPVKW